MNPNHSSPFWEQYQLQCFPLPKPIINYIIYAKIYPNAHQKLFKSCKYFFAKNPVIIIARLFFYDNETYTYKNSIADRKILPENFQYWISHAAEVYGGNEKMIKEKIVDRLYDCNLMYLDFHRTILSKKDFISLSKNATDCNFHDVVVKDNNDKIIPIEEIIQSVPCCDNFYCTFDEARYTQDTAEKLIQISRFSSLQTFSLGNLPEIFDPEILLKHLKDTKSHMRITLEYSSPNLSNVFISKVSKINKEIISTEKFDFCPLFIRIPGQNKEEWKQYCNVLFKFWNSLCIPLITFSTQ